MKPGFGESNQIAATFEEQLERAKQPRTADYGLYDFMAARVLQHLIERPELLRPIAAALAKELWGEIQRQKPKTAAPPPNGKKETGSPKEAGVVGRA